MKKVILSVLLAAGLVAMNHANAQQTQTQTQDQTPAKTEHKKHGPTIDEQVAQLKTELGLREEQVPQVKDAITAHRETMKTLRKENKDNTDKAAAKEKYKAENIAFKAKMKSILNDAQYKKYEEMKKDQRKAYTGEHKKNKEKKAE